MYDKNVAVIGCTIEKTTKYDQFREDKIRMELYRVILALYGEGYRTFTCNLNTYIGLLAADTVIILRKADKCALYDDLIKQADSKETLPEKESFGNMLAGSHIVCYYDDLSNEMQRIRTSGTPYINIRQRI